ncbi:MAG: type IV pilus assembly protein PilM [Planctomycetota bacterium]|jgi:type IV pilus assembly protein PilM
MFGFKRNQVIGIDVGSAAIKIVQLRKSSGGWSVAAAGIVRIGRQSDKGGELASVRAIQNCMDVSGGGSRLAVCGVGGRESAIRDFDLEEVEPFQIEQAILAETEHLNPFDTEEIVYDYRLLSNCDGRMKGYVAASTQRLVNSKLNLIKKAGLKCAMVDLEALSLINCRNELDKSKDHSSTAIINIGNSCTTFVAESKDKQPFVREIPFGGRDIFERLAVASETSVEEVEEYLFSKNGEKNEYSAALPTACRQLITEINKTVRFYEAQADSSSVEKLLVCGGVASAKGLVDVLGEETPVEAVLWNPCENMKVRLLRNHNAALRNNIIRNSGPALAVAVGLAMRSI